MLERLIHSAKFAGYIFMVIGCALWGLAFIIVLIFGGLMGDHSITDALSLLISIFVSLVGCVFFFELLTGVKLEGF